MGQGLHSKLVERRRVNCRKPHLRCLSFGNELGLVVLSGNVVDKLEENGTEWKRTLEKGPVSSSQTCPPRRSLNLLIGGVNDYNSPHVRESRTFLDSGFRLLDFGFQHSGFRIPKSGGFQFFTVLMLFFAFRFRVRILLY